MDISVLIPLYNEEESIPELMEWIDRVMKENSFTYEVIMIDDGSDDNSWKVIEELRKKYPELEGIRFRRNYGKSAALNEGFIMAVGDVIITMDADLQDSPDEIPELYSMIVNEDYDMVSGWKKVRYDSKIAKNIPSKLFNWAARRMSGIKLHDFNCGLKSYKYDVVKSIEVYGEMHRYIPVIAKYAGFKKIGEKVVQHRKRKYGVTKFGWSRFINGFLDLISLSFITRFEKKPMHFFGLGGVLFFFLGGGITLWLLIEKLVNLRKHIEYYRQVTDQPLFYLALLAMVFGLILFMSGFLGEIIVRSSQNRSNYQLRNNTKMEL
jgi:glycosyltransferase involved in cell wall biosynthesis